MAEAPPESRLLRDACDLHRPFRPEAPERGAGDGPDPVVAAFERGHEEGRIEGRDEVATEYARRAEALRLEVARSLKRIADLEETLVHRHRQTMIDLALEIASRIVRARIEAGDPVVARALAEALDAAPDGQPIRARVHPDDVGAVRDELNDLVERRRVEIEADEEIERGGCVVEAPGGTIDASVATALDAMREAAVGHVDTS